MHKGWLAVAGVLISLSPACRGAARSASSERVRSLDRTVAPCVDFYQFACGGWLAQHPIPPDASSWTLYDEITARNQELVHRILDQAASKREARIEAERKVGTYFAACMDQPKIDALALAPLRSDLDAIAAIANPNDLLVVLARLQARGVDAPISIYSNQDFDDATRVIAEADRASPSLPARTDYLGTDEPARTLRLAYGSHLARLFALLGESAQEADADAARVLTFERGLASATRDAVSRRDSKSNHHPVAIGNASKGQFRWKQYLALLSAPPVSTLNVVEPRYFDAIARLVDAPDLESWRAYLRIHLLDTMTEVLPTPFQQEEFDFFGRTLQGARELRPRWKRCAELVDRDLGEVLGQLFVRQAFPEKSKERVRSLFGRIRDAMRRNLAEASWMTESTRSEAIAHLAKVRVKIGYPDHWRDYTSLLVAEGDAYGNAQRALMFEEKRQLAKIGRPVDRDEWFELPQHLDAYGTNQLNEVAFTAGFLQPPIFSETADDATVLGALGAVMGHELTHRYDDQGRQFDSGGNLREWWTAADIGEYEHRAACFAEQYSKYEILGMHVDGKLTLGENLADNGGLRLAFRAAETDKDRTRIDGFTAAQRLFLSWAQIRCSNVTEQKQRARLRGDPHSPGRFRTIGTISNMPEFADAFECPASSPMKNEPICRLW